MAYATNDTPGTINLNGDLHGSNNGLEPELTPTGVTIGTYVLANIVTSSKGLLLTVREETDISDLVPCANDTDCGLVQIGTNLTVDGNGTVDYPGDATIADLGIVQAGNNIDITAGVISFTFNYSTIATATTQGAVIVPTAGNLTVDVPGNLSLNIADTIDLGGVYVPTGGNLTITDGDLGFSGIPYPDATVSSAGIVQTGNNINVASGVISVPDGTNSSKGVVSVDQAGTGLSISGGILTYVAPPADLIPATDTTLGVVIVPTSGHLNIDGSGNVDIDIADSDISVGVIKSADEGNIVISGGDIDIGPNIPATDTSNVWSKRQVSTQFDISSTANTTLDLLQSDAFELTLVGDANLEVPINSISGSTFTVIVKQDATGSHALTFDPVFKFSELPIVTQPANSVDVFYCTCQTPTEIHTVYISNYF